MAVKADDAIAAARALLGTPYAQLDCINLIKKVIRSAPGGRADYTTAGTNALWKSYNSAAKYRDLTWRQEGLGRAKAGMIAFKSDGADFRHAGIVTERGTVIHSSSAQGGRGVVETPLTAAEGWTHLAAHRYIETAASAGDTQEEDAMAVLYQARVNTREDPLNVRDYPKTGRILGKVAKDKIVDVVSEKGDGWVRIVFNELVGYASAEYLERIEEAQEEPAEPDEEEIIAVSPDVTIIDSAGNRFKPVGSWRVLVGGVD